MKQLNSIENAWYGHDMILTIHGGTYEQCVCVILHEMQHGKPAPWVQHLSHTHTLQTSVCHVQGMAKQAMDAVSGLGNSAGGAAGSAGEGAQGMVQNVMDAAGNLGQGAGNAAGSAGDSASGAAGQVQDAAGKLAGQFGLGGKVCLLPILVNLKTLTCRSSCVWPVSFEV